MIPAFRSRASGNTSKSSTATVAGLTNLAFSHREARARQQMAVPSHWVSYIVTTVPSTSRGCGTAARPSTDNTGTLVDHGDGTYTYTFYRDITHIKSQVDGNDRQRRLTTRPISAT